MSAKITFRDRLVCLQDFVGKTLLLCFTTMAAFRFPLPLFICFLRVFLPTLFAADLKFFLALTPSATFGTAGSN